jgi:hypothetical protein
VQSYLIKELEKMGGIVFKGIVNNKSGYPDLTMCLNGLFYAIEVKKDNGVPSPLQIYRVETIRKAKGEACFVYGMSGAKLLLADIKLKATLKWEYK